MMWLCCIGAEGVRRPPLSGADSDGESEFGERVGEAMSGVGVDAEFVVAAAQVLDEGMTGADHSCRAEPCEPAHRPQPGFQPAVISFDGVVRVLLGDVCGGQQLVEYAGGRPVLGRWSPRSAVRRAQGLG